MKTVKRICGLALLVTLGVVNSLHIGIKNGQEVTADGIGKLEQHKELEVFNIDLDLPPKERFIAPTKRFKKEILAMIEVYENLLINEKISDQFKIGIDQAL